MPWAAVDYPSLALGEITTIIAAIPDVTVESYYENLSYVSWLDNRCPIGAEDYEYLAVDSYFEGVGDWVFSSALHGVDVWREKQFGRLGLARVSTAQQTLVQTLHRLAPTFITDAADRISAANLDVVGFTTTFQQNVASLALARRLKRLRPDVVTIFGGANCDGPQGAAIHRNYAQVDFVVRGEAELALPMLIEEMRGRQDYASIPRLCWRTTGGNSVANAESTSIVPPSRFVTPDFDAYFEQWNESRAARWKEPALVLEGARGCWWGEKHHCTFCGLNGSSMKFRSKSPDAVFQEMIDLSSRHRVLDIVMVDNILDMSTLRETMPRLSAAALDLRIHYEIKSNLRRHQLEALSAAGVTVVQPGIESLSTRVLSLMRKGVTGCQNVRLLRDSEGLGLTVSWNYLFGFPAETDDDYARIIEQLPALHHLMPPSGSTRIAIERFSPYFNEPELGFAELTPARQYGVIYDLEDRELRDLAFLFDCAAQGIGDELGAVLGAACAEWRENYHDSRLTYSINDGSILLVNRRVAFDWQAHVIDEPLPLALFHLLDDPHRVGPLARKAAALCDDEKISESDVLSVLAHWSDLGLIFSEGDAVVQVAAPSTNQEILKR